jgi:hypothetical protein
MKALKALEENQSRKSLLKLSPLTFLENIKVKPLPSLSPQKKSGRDRFLVTNLIRFV